MTMQLQDNLSSGSRLKENADTEPKKVIGDRKQLRVVAMVNNACTTDARVIRQAEALAQAGHKTLVLAHWSPTAPEQETINGVTYKRFAVRHTDKIKRRQALAKQKSGQAGDAQTHIQPEQQPIFFWKALSAAGRLVRAGARRTLTLFKRITAAVFTGGGLEIARHARAYPAPATAWRPDVIHAHDLYTLLAGYRIARRTGAALIYDSHELEVGRNGNFSKWERYCRATIERILICQATDVITVGDCIADFLATQHQIARPTVIHNAPQTGAIDPSYGDIRQRLQLADDVPLALYVGRITTNRGLEQAVNALELAPEFHLACVGPSSDATMKELTSLIAKLGIGERVHFVAPVPHDKVTSFIRTADVSLILIQDACLSYRYCFPNKLLESILAYVPVVASNLPELTRIVGETGAGVITDQTDPIEIARSMQEVTINKDRYMPTADVLTDINERFSLEVQNRRLLELYDRLT